MFVTPGSAAKRRINSFTGPTGATGQTGTAGALGATGATGATAGAAGAFVVTNIGTNSNTSGGTLTLTNVTVPKGSTIFVCVTERSSGTAGTLDDGGINTYTTLSSGTLNNSGTNGIGILFAVTNCAALSNATITYTKNNTVGCAISAIYVTGASTAVTFTEGLGTAFGSTGTITVTSGTISAGDLVLGVLFDGGTSTAGGNATFTNAAGFVTPPNEAKSATASTCARVDGGTVSQSSTGTVVYNPTLSSTAQVWFIVVLGILPGSTTGPAGPTGPNLTGPTGPSGFGFQTGATASASSGPSGYFEMSNIIMQWGEGNASNAAQTFTFPVAFVNQVPSITIGATGTVTNSGTATFPVVVISSISKTGFQAGCNTDLTGYASSTTFFWQAIGS